MRDVVVEPGGRILIDVGETLLELARRDGDAGDDVPLLELFDEQIAAAVVAIRRVVDALRREQRGQFFERVAEVLRYARECLVEQVVVDGDADTLGALQLNLAQDELIEHLLLDHGDGWQRSALLGRRLGLRALEVLHHEREALGELALQDDAFVDDRGHAFEQLAAGAELAILRVHTGRNPSCERGRDGHESAVANAVHKIALLSRHGRYCDNPEYHGRGARPAPWPASTSP